MHWYYYGHHSVDDNNNNCKGCLSFNDQWDLGQVGFVFALWILAYIFLTASAQTNFSTRRENTHKNYHSRAFSMATMSHENVDPNKNGYVCPATRDSFKIGAKIVKKDASVSVAHRLCKTDANYVKWDGEKFPMIITKFSKIKCRMYKFEMHTFCFCNWGSHFVCIAMESTLKVWIWMMNEQFICSFDSV